MENSLEELSGGLSPTPTQIFISDLMIIYKIVRLQRYISISHLSPNFCASSP